LTGVLLAPVEGVAELPDAPQALSTSISTAKREKDIIRKRGFLACLSIVSS
jgi:hypothetical protein